MEDEDEVGIGGLRRVENDEKEGVRKGVGELGIGRMEDLEF